MNRKKSVSLQFLSIAVCLAPVLGQRETSGIEASDVLVFGNQTFSLRPQFELLEQYNDNIFFARNNKTEDLITILVPGLRFLVGDDLPDANHFSFRYNLEDLLYVNRSDQDALQHKMQTSSRYEWHRFRV